jgi:hypothetical protein
VQSMVHHINGNTGSRSRQGPGALVSTGVNIGTMNQIPSDKSRSISSQNYGMPSPLFTAPRRSEARSLLRWLGFFFMNVGETGNFISYAFAPASVVAPLGTVIVFLPPRCKVNLTRP